MVSSPPPWAAFPMPDQLFCEEIPPDVLTHSGCDRQAVPPNTKPQCNTHGSVPTLSCNAWSLTRIYIKPWNVAVNTGKSALKQHFSQLSVPTRNKTIPARCPEDTVRDARKHHLLSLPSPNSLSPLPATFWVWALLWQARVSEEREQVRGDAALGGKGGSIPAGPRRSALTAESRADRRLGCGQAHTHTQRERERRA